MPLADEWRISCQSLLVSGDGFEPGLQNNSLWLTSSAICTLNLDNIWLNKSKVIISQVDKLFKISPALQLLQTALTKKVEEYSHKSRWDFSLVAGKYLQPKTKLCWSMKEQCGVPFVISRPTALFLQPSNLRDTDPWGVTLLMFSHSPADSFFSVWKFDRKQLGWTGVISRRGKLGKGNY